MQNGDNIIYSLFNGKMVKTGKAHGPETKNNFLIICEYGDWSRFRTLAECEAQFAELTSKNKPNFYYQVVER